MTLLSLFSTTFLLLSITAGSCRNQALKSDATPYPTIAAQRQLLAGKVVTSPVRLLDSIQVINDLEYFASDICAGRKPGTTGHANSVQKILERMRQAGVDSFDNDITQRFTAKNDLQGINIAGFVKGTTFPDKYIVISAHYDHLGKAGSGATYYGADDNASAVACMLAMAKYYKANPHAYSLIFVALDKEETGLEGGYAFVKYLAATNRLAAIKFNLNLDMVARSDGDEIFACGITQNPGFKYVVDEVQNKTKVKLLMGHDTGFGSNNWVTASDHAAFAEKKIPFIYVGVEDHEDYHKTTDTYSRINYSNYIENCNMILMMCTALKP